TIATVLVAYAVLSPLEQSTFAGAASAASLYVSNVWFARTGVDYLAAPPDTNPLLHFWSLSVEEQFYLVWPCALLILWRLRRPVAGTAVAVAISFALTIHLMKSGSPWAFFGAHARAWEFGVGSLAALTPFKVASAVRRPVAWSGMLAIVAAML